MTEVQRDIAGYAVLAMGSVAFLVWGIPAFTPEYPGYGVPASLVPNMAVRSILVLTILGICRTLFSAARQQQKALPEAGRIQWLHLLRFLLPGVLLMPAMTFLGFIPAGLCFMVVVQLFCGQRRLLPLVLVSVLPVSGVYMLMRFVLSVPLP